MRRRRSGVCAAALVLACAVPDSTRRPGEADVLLLGGWIVDGTGNPRYRGDVALASDRIVAVGHLDGVAARETLDVRGLVVAPGFIDMLGHSETNVLIDNRAFSKVTQGITTEITGEGGSVAPLTDALVAEDSAYIKRYNLDVDWRTLDEYFARLERTGSAVNVATFVGATQVRRIVIGDGDRPATAAELGRMVALVDTAMVQGALGLSTSLIYAPAVYAPTEELIALARMARLRGGVYATHMRNEGASIDAALDETFRIAREADIPVEIWHLKVAGCPACWRASIPLAPLGWTSPPISIPTSRPRRRSTRRSPPGRTPAAPTHCSRGCAIPRPARASEPRCCRRACAARSCWTRRRA